MTGRRKENTMEQNNSMALTTMEENNNFITDLTAKRVTAYCSLNPQKIEEKKLLFKAMNNPEKRIGDCINMTIKVKNIYAEIVTCVNRDTGESAECPRIVLIDEKGVGYQAVSLGIFSAVKKLFQIFGTPETWDKPIDVQVLQLTKGERKILTLNIA
jgi:hypothetical protein